MFESLFKYPFTMFAKSKLVLLAGWPAWMMALAMLGAAAALGWVIRRQRARSAPGVAGLRLAVVWLLQTSLVASVLVLLWHPALSVTTLKPQQNIIAVLVDDSRSMAIREDGKTRLEQAVGALNGGLLGALEQKFQVRLYRFGGTLERLNKLDQLAASSPVTHIGETLKQVVAEGASLPIGAVLLLSDGADNSGGIDLETIAEIRRHRIPVHTVGLGREHFSRDVEIGDVVTPARSLADSRLSAQVTFRQHGYARRNGRLVVREGGKVLASQEVVFQDDGARQTESLLFNAGIAGARNLQVSIDPLDGEENLNNNAVSRLVNVESAKPRLLYLEGEPRWEFKFIRRAIEQDRSLQLATILRTTQNKIYRQGIANPKELEDGFPSTAEELFAFQGLILGNVEIGSFTPAQRELIRLFADRRGGGVLFLGGRATLADGGYAASPFAELLPVALPESKGTFHREEAGVELTAAGRDSLICRIEDQAGRNAERWNKLPLLADYQEVGTPKPGAVVLAELFGANKRRMPLLVTQNYGRGRTALFATGGSWRWQMLQDHSDLSHEMFWQQLLRWLVVDAPGRVVASTPRLVLADEARLPLRVEVRDKSFQPVLDARVEAHILGPEGLSDAIEISPQPAEEGTYVAEWSAEKPGSYLAEILAKRGEEEVGRDVLMFRREDGVAENFRAEQNRELLEKLAEQTGGNYYRPGALSRLPEEISYSEAGITVRETKDLWDMPIVFLLILSLCASQWLLRRKWGVV